MPNKELDTEKLGKIIALAKRGEGGEKENARVHEIFKPIELK